MKRISFLFLLAFLTLMFISSCTDSVTYAQQLKTEKATIAAYIKRHNINVISKAPRFSAWGPNDYLLTSDGLYFHLVDSGDVITDIKDTMKITVKANNAVIPRYKEYILDDPASLDLPGDTLITNKWSTSTYPYTDTFKYLDYTTSCVGFHEAVGLMRRNGAVARLIIPSKIGFNSSDVRPFGYDLIIKIQK